MKDEKENPYSVKRVTAEFSLIEICKLLDCIDAKQEQPGFLGDGDLDDLQWKLRDLEETGIIEVDRELEKEGN